MTLSLQQLPSRKRREQMEFFRPTLEAKAARLGLDLAPDTDIWELARRVHEAEDDEAWPQVAAEAEALGIETHTRFRKRRRLAELKLAIWREQDYRSLLKRYGYDHCEE